MSRATTSSRRTELAARGRVRERFLIGAVDGDADADADAGDADDFDGDSQGATATTHSSARYENMWVITTTATTATAMCRRWQSRHAR